MTIDYLGLTPEELAEAPELAAVHILECAAETTGRALLAALPDLENHEFLLEHANVTPQLCLGAAVLSSLGTLKAALERYRVHMEQLANYRPPGPDTIGF
ncbi:MAG: hypothetical protein WCI57_05540 [Candidatus Berkelbacteria bacterium]